MKQHLSELTPEQHTLYERRIEARKRKHFVEADRLRALLEQQGVDVVAIDLNRRGPLK